MDNGFFQWLQQNQLKELFTTSAGDTFYYNKERGIGAIKTMNPFNVQSFNLNDVYGFETKDDEILVSSWNRNSFKMVAPKGTRYSTNEVYINITFMTRPPIKLQVFRAVSGNISRSTPNHWGLYNYACQLSQSLYDCIMGNI